MKKFRSLSFRIPIIIISMILLLVSILAVLSVFSSGRAIKKTALEGFHSTISGFSYVLDMVLHEQKLAISTYSQSPILLDGILYRNDENLKTLALDTLKKFSSVNEYSINLGISDINGNIILDDANPNLIGKSLNEEHSDLMTMLRENNYNAVYDNKIVMSSTTGAHAILLCVGIRDLNNNVAGIVYLNLDLEKINSYFLDNIPFSGRVSVINNNNMEILLSSDSQEIGQKLSSDFDVIKNTKSGIIEDYHYRSDNAKRTLAYNRIMEMPWTITLSKPNGEIYREIANSIIRILIIAPSFMILFSLFIFIYINTITKPLIKLTLEAKEISEGNLIYKKLNINSKDELGELALSFQDIKHKLSSVIKNVMASSDEISMSSRELSQQAVNLSSRTESQAASLEETASSMEEMASTIKSSTEQAVEGNNMMIDSRDAVKNACDIILETTRNIEEVNDASNKIKDITKIIEDIAFQTNILALNASVEAARAGDMGKGFAVVASEVRNLAQTTQSSVKDITNLVDNAYEKINKATESVRASQEIFIEIQSKIDDTARIMQDISSTAIEQNAGVEQVNKAVADMDIITQKNASLVEEASSATEVLLNKSLDLVDYMSFFKLDDK